MMRIGIVADDLTGAADTAAQFVRTGWDTELQLRVSKTTAAVVAVTTDSRGRSTRDAAAAVTAAVNQLREAGITHLYKKIDSTLRGQIRAEVHAAVDNWSPQAIAVVCPAFPAMGRTVVDGQLRVEGVPVSDTAMRADPIAPVTQSHIPTMLRAFHVEHTFGESPRDLAGRIAAGGPLVVVDAASEDDLRHLANAIVVLGSHVIPVGSAGLARHLAMLWSVRPSGLTTALRGKPHSAMSSVTEGAAAIVIVTSLQEVARRQAAVVAAAGAEHYEPTAKDLLQDDAWASWSASVLDEFHRVESTLLLTAPEERSRDLPATLIPRRFADLTARIIKDESHKTGGRISGVVVTGGDGARALVESLEASGVELRGEVISGVPIGTLVGGPAAGLHVVTKAGGFGAADTLLRAIDAVADRRYA